MSFRKDFLWGTASAAPQVEGAIRQAGKGATIWEALSAGKVKHNDDNSIACDYYNRYKEDVAIMKQLGMKSYRFSISWARIFPDDTGRVNEKGIQFYSALVDELKSAGIEPIVTLYHWDLPLWLYEKGGWKDEYIVDEFARYAKTMIDALSDRVQYWLTFNEPQCFVGNGYVRGEHAPFEKTTDLSVVGTITRNVMLAHGKAVDIMRAAAKQPLKIGYSPTCNVITPANDSAEAVERARSATFDASRMKMYSTSWWSDPIVLGKRAEGMDFLSEEDLASICRPLDFYAFNIYNAGNYYDAPGLKNPMVYSGMPRTMLDWVICPDCMYWAAKFMYERYKLPIMITENSMANADFVMSDGKVHDPQRTDFIKRYLKELKKAVEEGVPVLGYQYWSFSDNFEWAEGYSARFGLVYIDYRTQQRIVKDSAYEYAKIVAENGENL